MDETKFYTPKPLTWEELRHWNGGRSMFVAVTRIGEFRVWLDEDNRWHYVFPGFTPIQCESRDNALKYCQREHDRIAASLMEPVPVDAECR